MTRSMPETYEALAARVGRRHFIAGAAAAGAATALGGPMLWRRPARADDVTAVAPHLQFGADPRAAMTVSWSTPVAVTDAALRYRPAGGDWSEAIPADDRVVRALGSVASPSEYHHVALTGLAAGTPYEYALADSPVDAVSGSFTTAPAAGAPFAFTAFGDQGTDGTTNGTRPSTMTAAIAAEAAAFHLHVGDLCYANRAGMGHDKRIPDKWNTRVVDPATWDTWLKDMATVAANRPWMPAVGNHEMEPGYGLRGYESMVTRFTLPGNGAPPPGGDPMVTYAFDYGNVRVIALDANDANYEIPANHGYMATAQDAWLEAQLQSARAPESVIDWIVVGYHQCSYCTNLLHGSDQGMRDRWDALFASYDVDLVVNGHNHSYERAHPVLAARVGPLDVVKPVVVDPRSDGTTFVTAGCGGSPRVEATAHPLSYVSIDGGARVPELAPWSVARYLDLSYIRVEVDPSAKSMTVIAKGLAPMLPVPGRALGEVDRVTLTRA